ncbi:hypothetical protein PVAP13_1NG139438 [Panicum virgatum]|uniref:Uncharacterized protein n=1 Tax=Panicum virgatum TaxID=38727 RepID=A0A8T0X0D9_PANVG|nr:hypothetical protein PVAP13_1NG139438 [Panicum virgatum]
MPPPRALHTIARPSPAHRRLRAIAPPSPRPSWPPPPMPAPGTAIAASSHRQGPLRPPHAAPSSPTGPAVCAPPSQPYATAAAPPLTPSASMRRAPPSRLRRAWAAQLAPSQQRAIAGSHPNVVISPASQRRSIYASTAAPDVPDEHS